MQDKNDNGSKNRRALLCDLLFASVFGATFSFKLQALHDMGRNPLTQPLEYASFFGYSIIFILIYWKWIRPEKNESWLDLVFTLVSSLAPYPALQISLWVRGTQQQIFDLQIALVIIIQCAIVGIAGYHKVKKKRD